MAAFAEDTKIQWPRSQASDTHSNFYGVMVNTPPLPKRLRTLSPHLKSEKAGELVLVIGRGIGVQLHPRGQP